MQEVAKKGEKKKCLRIRTTATKNSENKQKPRSKQS